MIEWFNSTPIIVQYFLYVALFPFFIFIISVLGFAFFWLASAPFFLFLKLLDRALK